MILFIEIGCAITLVMFSAFFSAAETALVSLSPQKAKRLALRSPNLAQAIVGWLGQPHELLTVILVGNTLTVVIFAALATTIALHIFSHVSPTQVEINAWIIQTVFMVIFGEMVPKFFARRNPEKTSLWALPVLSFLRIFMRPFLTAVTRIINAIFPSWKAPPVGQLLIFNMDELKSLLEETPVESTNMMQRVLDINHRQTSDIMTPLARMDFVEIDPAGKPKRNRDLLIDLIVEDGHTRTPIKLGGQFIGFIHSQDLLSLMISDQDQLIEHMVRPTMNVAFNKNVVDLLEDFKKSGTHVAFVRDAKNDVIGLVTLEDVMEEITGEILDEYDAK